MPEPNTLDVQSLMEDIKQRVRERIEKGEFNEEEIRKIEETELSIQPNIEDLLNEIKTLSKSFDSLLAPLNDLWAPHKPLPQPGVKGKLIFIIQKLFSPLTRVLFSTQMAFNAQVVHSLNDLKIYLARIIDLTANLAYLYRHYLAKIQGDLDEVRETQRRLFRLLLRAMNQHRNIRRDIRHLGEKSTMEKVRGIMINPAETPANTLTPEDNETDDTLYLSFEDLHRGSREQIMERQRAYLLHFSQCRRVLDIGCGRGEFLELLKKSGVNGVGIDINPAMVSYCQALGLNVEKADAVAHLSETPAGHYDGIFCAQVVEHLTWPQILTLLRLSYEKLPEGGKILMETINPQCLTTFSGAFYLDPTHVKPVHPLTLQFACRAIGFSSSEIIFTSLIPDEMKLKEVDFFRRIGDVSDKLINVLNDNVIQLNELLYAPQDYAILAVKEKATSL